MARKKRVVCISDLHCGHRAGLTPPAWQHRSDHSDVEASKMLAKWAKQQQVTWNWFRATMIALRPIDLLIVNGDAVEGKGKRSGGTELITSAQDDQTDMATHCIQVAQAKSYRMTRGTPYHTGEDDDWENIIAKNIGAKIGDHEWYDVNGLVFDVKHHIGGSSVPYSRATPLGRDGLWNLIWADLQLQPKADVLIRSHVHYCFDCQGIIPTQRYIVTPALQGFGSKYGARRCSGTVNVGFVSFDIESKETWSWQRHLLDLRFATAKAEQW